MPKLLIVEDSEMVTKVVRHLAQQHLPHITLHCAATQAEALALCDQQGNDFFAALVDLNLPDAPNGEVVDSVLARQIPAIVLTGSYDDARREQLFAKGIVDYVTKEGRYAYTKAIELVARLEKNQTIKVLVVDDSELARKHLANLLRRHLFQVLEASDGVEAIRVMVANPDVRLLITDYHMPNMDGFELVRNLRYKYDKTDLVMIGLSGESSEALSARFIKQGANDFLRKPFHPEELYCRVIHNLESLELIERITYTAQRDHLTGLYHRHHFFSVARDCYQMAETRATPLAAVAINIDHFQQVNDRYGNRAGDLALQHVARLLEQMLGRFVLARADGDSFYALLPGIDNERALALMGQVRQQVMAAPLALEGEQVSLSFSAGVCNQPLGSLDQQLQHAEEFLRRAKEAGRNLVVGDDDDRP